VAASYTVKVRTTSQRVGAGGNVMAPVSWFWWPRLKYSGSSQCRWMPVPSASDGVPAPSGSQIVSPVLASLACWPRGSRSKAAVRPAKAPVVVTLVESGLDTRSAATFSGTIAFTANLQQRN
jgi:hypothetical protein